MKIIKAEGMDEGQDTFSNLTENLQEEIRCKFISEKTYNVTIIYRISCNIFKSSKACCLYFKHFKNFTLF